MSIKTRRISPLFLALVIIRTVNALVISSYFQADEFWQSLEPAHWKAFGYGEITWEWENKLRSYAFPFMFEIVYRAARFVAKVYETWSNLSAGLLMRCVTVGFPNWRAAWQFIWQYRQFNRDVKELIEYTLVIYGPKVAMALLGATGEFYLIQFVQKVFAVQRPLQADKKDQTTVLVPVAQYATILCVTNFFNCFMITRSFINTFEMDLTCIALYFWDWSGGTNINSTNFTKSLFCAFFVCLQRPTNAFIWIPLGLFLVMGLLGERKYYEIGKLGFKISYTFTLAFAINLAIDFYFYGELTFPVYRFFEFNVTSSLSSFYGKSPWHFHLLQSIPIILGYSIPLVLYGFFKPEKRNNQQLLTSLSQIKVVIIVNIILFSLIPHKEFRFLYMLHPLFTALATSALLDLSLKYRGLDFRKTRFWILPLISVIAAMLLSSSHETGVVEVMKYLHNIPNVQSIGFVMPCHSTPWQSYLHRNDILDLWSISCEPPLFLLKDPSSAEKLQCYMDESDILYDDIPLFFQRNFPPFSLDKDSQSRFNHTWPEFLIIFQHLDDIFMNDYLRNSGYMKFQSFYNSKSHWDSRRAGDVIIYYRPELIY
ncbi:LAMI_0E02696g1_1 [Lachancea mirantina]|uniref:Mannosyltransferase n=1 Tax=Lachancea mirantina TaxID=1230905 RepID=A0A1G4JJH1_9SACH|nr:LAMI_0E02696g1_1 [Lachancea mirantina]